MKESGTGKLELRAHFYFLGGFDVKWWLCGGQEGLQKSGHAGQGSPMFWLRMALGHTAAVRDRAPLTLSTVLSLRGVSALLHLCGVSWARVEAGLSQHLQEVSVPREIGLGLPSNKDSMFKLCKIWVWRSGYSIQSSIWAEGWQQQMSDQGRRGHTSTAQSFRGLLGALANALKYLEDNNELARSLCHTHSRLISFSLIQCLARWIKEQQQMEHVFS